MFGEQRDRLLQRSGIGAADAGDVFCRGSHSQPFTRIEDAAHVNGLVESRDYVLSALTAEFLGTIPAGVEQPAE